MMSNLNYILNSVLQHGKDGNSELGEIYAYNMFERTIQCVNIKPTTFTQNISNQCFIEFQSLQFHNSLDTIRHGAPLHGHWTTVHSIGWQWAAPGITAQWAPP